MGTYTYNKRQKRRVDGSRTGKQKPDEEIVRNPNAIPAIVDSDLWHRVQLRMDAKKRVGGREKAKELYLLSGLVYCGCCGHKMEGNSRYPAADRKKFISYRCSYRHHALACDNKEIKRDDLEEYVLCLLEQHLLNDDVVPELTKALNSNLAQISPNDSLDKTQCKHRLTELQLSKANIIEAIAKSGLNDLFTEKLNQIESEIVTVCDTIKRITNKQSYTNVTEDIVREYFSQFKMYVEQRNIPQVKKYIESYVERIDVYPDTIKVTFKVAFFFCSDLPQDLYYKFTAETTRCSLKTA